MNDELYQACVDGNHEVLAPYITQDPLNWVRACFLYIHEESQKNYHGCVNKTIATMEPLKPTGLVWGPKWFDLTHNPLGSIDDLKTCYGRMSPSTYHPYWYHEEHLWNAMTKMVKGPHSAQIDFSKISYNYIGSQRFHWKLIQMQSKQAAIEPTTEHIQTWATNVKHLFLRYRKDLGSRLRSTQAWLIAAKQPAGEQAFFQAIPEAPYEGFKTWRLLGHQYPLASYGAYHLIEQRIHLNDAQSGKSFIQRLEGIAKSLDMKLSPKDKEVLQWVVDTALGLPSNFEQDAHPEGPVIALLGAVNLTLPYLRTGSFAPQHLMEAPAEVIDFNSDFSV